MTSFETAIVVTGPEMDATYQQSFSVLGAFQQITECLQPNLGISKAGSKVPPYIKPFKTL